MSFLLEQPNEHTIESQFTSLQAELELQKQKNEKLRNQLLKQNQKSKALERKLYFHHQTGLPTHHFLTKELTQAVETVAGGTGSARFSVIILQLNNSYDMIKKTLKSSVAEWVLYQIASRLTKILQLPSRAFHTRENEFIILAYWRDDDDIHNLTKNIVHQLEKPHIFPGFHLSVEFHGGIAHFPDHGFNPSTLLHNADLALGAAQAKNKKVTVFKDEFRQTVVEKMELQNAIIRAIEAPALSEISRQFMVHYQPKVEFTLEANGKPVVSRISAEALMRWNHPEKGQIGPDTFIPLAEESGLILPIGKWLIYHVIQTMGNWKKMGLPKTKVSINVSPRQLKSKDLIQVLQSVLETNPVLPEDITLEMTETSVFEDPSDALAQMHDFKKLGLKISMDDFGTGYSSLSLLHRFPLDEIKIDKSFIKDLPHNRQDKAIVQSLINIANELKIDLVAEGVAEEAQFTELIEMGCRNFQGWHFSKALSSDDFVKWSKQMMSKEL